MAAKTYALEMLPNLSVYQIPRAVTCCGTCDQHTEWRGGGCPHRDKSYQYDAMAPSTHFAVRQFRVENSAPTELHILFVGNRHGYKNVHLLYAAMNEKIDNLGGSTLLTEGSRFFCWRR